MVGGYSETNDADRSGCRSWGANIRVYAEAIGNQCYILSREFTDKVWVLGESLWRIYRRTKILLRNLKPYSEFIFYSNFP